MEMINPNIISKSLRDLKLQSFSRTTTSSHQVDWWFHKKCFCDYRFFYSRARMIMKGHSVVYLSVEKTRGFFCLFRYRSSSKVSNLFSQINYPTRLFFVQLVSYRPTTLQSSNCISITNTILGRKALHKNVKCVC